MIVEFNIEDRNTGDKAVLSYNNTDNDPVKYEVKGSESIKQKLEEYFSTRRKYLIPESDTIDDYREDEAIPTDMVQYFELALGEMGNKTGIFLVNLIRRR